MNHKNSKSYKLAEGCLVIVKVESYFPKYIKTVLQNEPPGSWIPELPCDCIRLSSGYPAPSLVPTEEIKDAVGRLVNEEQDLPFHYLGSPRIEGLKLQIQKRLTKRGIKVQQNELLITAGACQAIDLIARILLDQETLVAVEAPTYMEALEIFQNYTKQIISIPVDGKGLQTEVFEEILKERRQNGLTLPRFLYTIPTFQNPTGTTMSPKRRKELLNLAAQYDFLILEDDAYGELAFAENQKPIKALDTQGRVLHVGSLSKVVAPGMRVGWVNAAQPFIDTLSWFKKDLDHPFSQSTMAAYLENVDINERLKKLKSVYETKCNALTNALKIYFPKQSSWYVPEGGYFVWIKIPGFDTTALLQQALDQGVSFIPGRYFFLNQEDGKEYLRLSFSFEDEKKIVRGVQKLGQLLS
jgi:2-aminoadipate transaminase